VDEAEYGSCYSDAVQSPHQQGYQEGFYGDETVDFRRVSFARGWPPHVSTRHAAAVEASCMDEAMLCLCLDTIMAPHRQQRWQHGHGLYPPCQHDSKATPVQTAAACCF
jgi:hypothetical protein